MSQESNWRGKFIQQQLEAHAEAAPGRLKGCATEFDLDPTESGEPKGAVEQWQLLCEAWEWTADFSPKNSPFSLGHILPVRARERTPARVGECHVL